MQLYRKIFKPFIDTVVSFTVFFLLSPVFVVLTLWLFIANDGHPFFLQKRPGFKRKIFRVVKFKTMNDRKDANGNLLPDEERLTLPGRFIRKTSLDELPQLINVMKGDMSLVGPRPLLVDYLDLYSPEQQRRHDVKPGITGWAQVNGRNAISWQEKFRYDVYYVDHQSWLLDLKILFMTVFKVAKSEGISSQTSATMERFTGNSK